MNDYEIIIRLLHDFFQMSMDKNEEIIELLQLLKSIDNSLKLMNSFFTLFLVIVIGVGCYKILWSWLRSA